MAYPSGLKMDIDLGHISPLVENGEGEFLISLIEFMSVHEVENASALFDFLEIYDEATYRREAMIRYCLRVSCCWLQTTE